MNWYSVSVSTDEKVVGKYPQTDGMGLGYNLNAPNSVWNIPNLKMPDFEPAFDYFLLDKKAKLTDVISTALINARGFLISNKLKTILDKFHLTKHIYYPVKILHKKDFITNYYWLHFIEDNSNDIDFKNSSFELMHPLPFFRTDIIKLDGKEADIITANRLANPDFKLFPKKIKNQRPKNIDFLVFDFLYNPFYVSADLIKALENNSITGINASTVNIPMEF